MITRDEQGKHLRLSVKELLSFFVYPDPIDRCDFRPYMLDDKLHNFEIADFVNKEIIHHISEEVRKRKQDGTLLTVPIRKRDSKLERFIKHTTMVVETMSEEGKYKCKDKKGKRIQ